MIRFLEGADFIKNKEGLTSLLTKYKIVFETLDTFDSDFSEGLVNNSPEDLDMTLKKATGYFTTLISIMGAFEAYKTNKGGIKALSEDERTVYELVKAYIDKADKMIIVCQTLRKNNTKEWIRQ